MKKLLNISLIFKIISIVTFICIIIFQNQLIDYFGLWKIYGADIVDRNSKLFIPIALIVIKTISLIIFITSYVLVRKGMKCEDIKRYEIIAIILIIISSFILIIANKVTEPYIFYDKASIVRTQYMYNITSLDNNILQLHNILFFIAAGISIGKKKLK